MESRWSVSHTVRQNTERKILVCSFAWYGLPYQYFESRIRAVGHTTELHLGASLYAMPPTTSIPRFLLPQRGAIWRTRLPVPTSTSLTIRSVSSKKKNSTSKPLVLEKPSKFVPPSHPARLRKEAPRYPGPQLSDEEIARQTKKKYPNMMPPEGSFMHWFIMNKTIHMWITLVLYNHLY